ncbi:MAG: AAA family ATPase [Deltaproteobacteria bacterium]|nr:AAA family ATPase [Deltaproteobacteria bacterium]
MYEEFYSLREKPFSLTPDPRFFFLSENHRGAFEHLLYGIKEKEGFILITGEVGAGKTTLCRALLDKLESQGTDTALILNPMFSGLELLQCVLGDFGIPSSGTAKKDLLDGLNRFLLNQQAAGRSSVLIIDEAQNLPLPVLEELRIVSNLETEKEKLLQIILMGQIELKEKLSLPRLRQLNQRISIRYHLQPLAQEEVPRYVHHRLTVAGSTGDLRFTPGALREIYRYSQGIPRLINLACDRALLAGYAEQTREIQRQVVSRGLKSLEGEETARKQSRVTQRLALGLAGVVIFFLGALTAILFLRSDRQVLKQIAPAGGPGSSPAAAAPLAGQAQPGSFYTVQLGAYRTEAEAVEVASRFKTAGYPLFLAKPKAAEREGRHRLYLGKFSDKSEAEELGKTFQKVEGFSGVEVVLTSFDTAREKAP